MRCVLWLFSPLSLTRPLSAACPPKQYDREHVRTELLNALMYMERGVKLFRLRSRQDMGGDGFPNCCSKRCRQVWSGGNTWTRQRNWFSYWCEKLPSRAKAKKLVAQCSLLVTISAGLRMCTAQPVFHTTACVLLCSGLVVVPGDDTLRTRCYTSQDTNWSNNPFLINREYIFHGEKVGNNGAGPFACRALTYMQRSCRVATLRRWLCGEVHRRRTVNSKSTC